MPRGPFSLRPRDIQYRESLVSLRQREGEQRAALARPEHSGQEPFRPRAPAGRHGDVLPSVDAVAGRAAVVAAAALELPQLLAGGRVERVELAGRLARANEGVARREDRSAPRDVVAPAPALLAGARVEGAHGPRHVIEVDADTRSPVRDALLELPAPPGGRRADVLHRGVQQLGFGVVRGVRPFLGAGLPRPEVDRVALLVGEDLRRHVALLVDLAPVDAVD